jgi:Rod binding domain-containing protein
MNGVSINSLSLQRPDVAGAASREETARNVANDLVASTFYQTLLKQIRESSLKSGLFHGGRGEEIFAEKQDAILAQQLASADRTGFGEAIFRTIQDSYEDGSN